MSLEAGTYTMQAAGPAKIVKSPEKGTQGIQVQCLYMDGPNTGKSIEWIGWMSEKAIARTAESLAHMGYDGSDLSTVTKLCFQGVTEYEQFDRMDGTQGERARLRWINGSSRMAQVDRAEEANAKARLQAAYLAAKAKASTPAAATDDRDEPNF